MLKELTKASSSRTDPLRAERTTDVTRSNAQRLAPTVYCPSRTASRCIGRLARSEGSR
jgi:hypothetical protein